jgi:hypothetical protein
LRTKGAAILRLFRHSPFTTVFNELLIQMKRAPKFLRDAQAEWLSIAEKQLSG